MALGATPAGIFKMVVGRGLFLSAVGVAGGFTAALVLLKALPSIKFTLPIPEALVVMVLGGLSVIFVLIRIIAKPNGAGIVHVGYAFGIFLTLIAAAVVTLGGFLKNSES